MCVYMFRTLNTIDKCDYVVSVDPNDTKVCCYCV